MTISVSLVVLFTFILFHRHKPIIIQEQPKMAASNSHTAEASHLFMTIYVAVLIRSTQ